MVPCKPPWLGRVTRAIAVARPRSSVGVSRRLGAFIQLPVCVVALDSRGVTHDCTIWTAAELAAGAALLEQVPALVQGDLEAMEASLLVLAEPVVLFAPSVERVLFVDQPSDALQNLSIVHCQSPWLHAPACSIARQPFRSPN